MSGVSAAFIRRRSCFHVLTGACRWATRTLTSQTTITEFRNPQIPLLMSSGQNSHLYDPTLDQMTQMKLRVPPISGICVGSSQGFLLSVDDGAADLRAFNPLTGADLTLPPTASLPSFVGVVRDLIRGEIITDYVIILDDNREGDEEDEEDMMMTRMRRKKRKKWQMQRQMRGTLCHSTMYWHFFGKAILSPSLDTAVVIKDIRVKSSESSFYGCKRPFPEIMFARPGVDASWATLSSPIGVLSDVIFSKRDSQLIYAVDDSGTVAAFRLDHGSSSSSPAPVYVIEGPSLGHEEKTEEKMFLVESPDGGSLFLLQGVRAWAQDRYNWSFKAFRLDSGGSIDGSSSSKWEAVESIGDLAFFVGKINSMSVSLPDPAAAAGDHGGKLLRPNCIYHDSGTESDMGCGVFSLETGIMKPSRRYDLCHRNCIWLNPPPHLIL